MRTARRVLGALLLVLALGLTTWELLRRTPLAERWWFDLPDIFAVWVELPLLAFGLLLALLWQRRTLVWLLVPLAVVASQYGPRFLPRAAPPSGTVVRVMSANLLVGSGAAGSLQRALAQEQPPDDAELLDAADPTPCRP